MRILLAKSLRMFVRAGEEWGGAGRALAVALWIRQQWLRAGGSAAQQPGVRFYLTFLCGRPLRIRKQYHYEMFAANQGRPGVLVDYVRASHPTLTCCVPAHGRRFIYKKGDLQ